MTRGKFIVIDGLDGVGKDTLIGGITEHIKQRGQEVFDVVEYWKQYHKHPQLTGEEADVYVTAEPTYVNDGERLRNIILPDKSERFSARDIASHFASDRYEHLRKNVLPLLKAGKTVFQSRSYISSLIYQQYQDGSDLSVRDILEISGNNFAKQHPPHVMLIPTIQDMNELERRLHNDDRDQDQFENLAFQKKIKPYYEGEWLSKYLASTGTKAIYFDAGMDGKQEAIRNAVDAYEQALTHLEK